MNKPRTHLPRFGRGWIVFGVLFVVGVVAFFHVHFGGRWQDWIDPKPVVTIAGFIIGFALLHWQLERQHENALEAHRLQAENKLKLEVYDKIVIRMDAAKRPLGELISKPIHFLTALRAVNTEGRRFSRLPDDFFPNHNVMALHEEISRSVIDLISILETYEIALDGFAVFRTDLWNKLEALGPPTTAFIVSSMKFSKNAATPSEFTWPPTDADYEVLDSSGNLIMKASLDLSCAIDDLRRDALNHLIGPLFPGRRVERRQPTDPTLTVACRDEGQTAWPPEIRLP